MFSFFDKILNKYNNLNILNNTNLSKYRSLLLGYESEDKPYYNIKDIEKDIEIYLKNNFSINSKVYQNIEEYYKYILSEIDFEALKSLKTIDEEIDLSYEEINFLRYIEGWDTSYKNFPKYFILRDKINIQKLLTKLYKYQYIFLDSLDKIEYIFLTQKSKTCIRNFFKTRYMEKDEKKICKIKDLEISYKENIKNNDYIEAKLDLNKLIEISYDLDYDDLLLEYIIRHITLDLFESELNIYKARSEGCSDETIDFLFKDTEFPYSIKPRYSKEIQIFMHEDKINEEIFYDLILNEARKLPVYTNDEKLYEKYMRAFGDIYNI